MSRLFAYGTLMYPEISREVIGREIPGRQASLKGHRAMCVAGYEFPGLIPTEETDLVGGLLFEGISEEEWHQLDVYESSMYERVVVSVDTGGDPGGSVDAFVYLVKEERRCDLTEEPWHPDPARLEHKS